MKIDAMESSSDPETVLRTLQNTVDLVSLEESIEIARAEAARAEYEMREQSRTIGNNFSEAIVSGVFSILFLSNCNKLKVY